MADVLSVIFDRWDRYPAMHEYGRAIDSHLDRLAGGGDRIQRGGADPQVAIAGFAARLELHETGPIFFFDPEQLSTVSSVFDDVRAIARSWAGRSTGNEPKVLSVMVRFGPPVVPGAMLDEHSSWERVKITTDPLIVAEHLDDLVAFVLRMGRA